MTGLLIALVVLQSISLLYQMAYYGASNQLLTLARRSTNAAAREAQR
jgi:hypothetical protein